MVGALQIVGDAGRPSRSMLPVQTSIGLQVEQSINGSGIYNGEVKGRTDACTVEHDISCSLVAKTHKQSNSPG